MEKSNVHTGRYCVSRGSGRPRNGGVHTHMASRGHLATRFGSDRGSRSAGPADHEAGAEVEARGPASTPWDGPAGALIGLSLFGLSIYGLGATTMVVQIVSSFVMAGGVVSLILLLCRR